MIIFTIINRNNILIIIFTMLILINNHINTLQENHENINQF